MEPICFEIQGLQRAVDGRYSYYIHAYDIIHAYLTTMPIHRCEVKPCVQSKEKLLSLHLHRDEPASIYTLVDPRSMIYIPFSIY